jgi:hypothetical protein
MIQTIERIIDRQAGVAAQTENMAYAIALQHGDEGFGAGHLVHGRISLSTKIA